MKRFGSLLLLTTILLITGCKDDKFELPSELPGNIIGYQLVFYNTDVVSNPDDLYVSSRTVYYFEDENTIRGDGDDGSSLPTTSWEWTGDGSGDIIDFVVLDLDYGDNGQERFLMDWTGTEEDIEERQTFTGFYALAGYEVIEVEGYYEIEKRF